MVVGEKEARERRVDGVSCLGGADIIRQHLLASPHERMMASPIRSLSSAKCVTQPSSRLTCSRHCSRRRRHRRITVVNVSCAHKKTSAKLFRLATRSLRLSSPPRRMAANGTAHTNGVASKAGHVLPMADRLREGRALDQDVWSIYK